MGLALRVRRDCGGWTLTGRVRVRVNTTSSPSVYIREIRGSKCFFQVQRSEFKVQSSRFRFSTFNPRISFMPFTNLIDGRAIAAQIQAELTQRVATLKSRGVQPGLAFVRVGEDPASKVYVGRKEKACADLGIFSKTRVLPEATSEADLLGLLARLNADSRLHGILVQ